jgi:hypothetical protein
MVRHSWGPVAESERPAVSSRPHREPPAFRESVSVSGAARPASSVPHSWHPLDFGARPSARRRFAGVLAPEAPDASTATEAPRASLETLRRRHIPASSVERPAVAEPAVGGSAVGGSAVDTARVAEGIRKLRRHIADQTEIREARAAEKWVVETSAAVPREIQGHLAEDSRPAAENQVATAGSPAEPNSGNLAELRWEIPAGRRPESRACLSDEPVAGRRPAENPGQRSAGNPGHPAVEIPARQGIRAESAACLPGDRRRADRQEHRVEPADRVPQADRERRSQEGDLVPPCALFPHKRGVRRNHQLRRRRRAVGCSRSPYPRCLLFHLPV